MPSLVRQEKFLLIAALVSLGTFFVEHSLLEAGKVVAIAAAILLIGVTVMVSTRVAHHAEVLAHKVGEPCGTMILTGMDISMVVPEFVPANRWHYYSAFTICAMIALYALLLRMQVGVHSYFFSYSYPAAKPSGQPRADGDGDHHPDRRGHQHQ